MTSRVPSVPFPCAGTLTWRPRWRSRTRLRRRTPSWSRDQSAGESPRKSTPERSRARSPWRCNWLLRSLASSDRTGPAWTRRMPPSFVRWRCKCSLRNRWCSSRHRQRCLRSGPSACLWPCYPLSRKWMQMGPHLRECLYQWQPRQEEHM